MRPDIWYVNDRRAAGHLKKLPVMTGLPVRFDMIGVTLLYPGGFGCGLIPTLATLGRRHWRTDVQRFYGPTFEKTRESATLGERIAKTLGFGINRSR